MARFACNQKRKDLTEVSKKIASLDFRIDRFHFKNHVDDWCKVHCNPKDSVFLTDVNTEACEQLFAWFSKYSSMTKHMNRHHFRFMTLYLMDLHNEKLLQTKLKAKKVEMTDE